MYLLIETGNLYYHHYYNTTIYIPSFLPHPVLSDSTPTIFSYFKFKHESFQAYPSIQKKSNFDAFFFLSVSLPLFILLTLCPLRPKSPESRAAMHEPHRFIPLPAPSLHRELPGGDGRADASHHLARPRRRLQRLPKRHRLRLRRVHEGPLAERLQLVPGSVQDAAPRLPPFPERDTWRPPVLRRLLPQVLFFYGQMLIISC